MQFTSLRPAHLFGALGAVALGAALLIWAPWSAQARSSGSTAPRASNVSMNCAPGQQALVRQTIVNGELNVAVECANTLAANSAAYQTQFGQALPPMYEAAQVTPAVYRTVAPVRTYAPRASRAPRPVVRSVERKRDWRRDALIIGGSAGAGAGIGGLVGGKKGALIGAALGGGGAALYRVAKD